MAVAVRVPDLGTTVDEVRLVAWLVEEGQSVKRGDALAEIETDKATTELESVAEGVLLKALAESLRAFPPIAAKLEGDRIVRREGRHIAVAIDRGAALFLPVVRDVDRKGLAEVQRYIVDFAGRARRAEIGPDEMTGGCMTLSNLGMFPIESFDAIIFPEHSAILAVGATQRKPVVVAERVEIRPLVNVALSVDHRLINGRAAAAFLTKVKEVLESGEIN